MSGDPVWRVRSSHLPRWKSDLAVNWSKAHLPKGIPMKRRTHRLVTSGVLAALALLLSSGAAEARIAVNHNENRHDG